jgi:hypothetical protein
MKFLAAIVAALLFLAPAGAAEEPETAYGRFHRALAANNVDEMMRYASDARRAELTRMDPAQRVAAAKAISSIMPRAYQLRDKTVSPDGKAARLVVAGPVDAPGVAPMMYGTVRMTLERGEWKVIEANWSPDTPVLLSPVNPGGSYAPPPAPRAQQAPAASAPAGRAAAAAPRAGSAEVTPPAAPIVGSTTGAPLRKLGTAKPPCVYKPVMTNEDLENCR